MPGSSETSPNNFGTDEVLELSERLGAPLLITVNIVTGTPQEAVEWLQYIRARTGPGKAPPVTYWEIGNEQYVKGDEPYVKTATMPPDEYARRFLDFARALKAADPSIKTGAISDENYGSTIPHPYPSWTEKVLERAADRIDFISVHDAYVPMVIDPRGRSLRDIYTGMLAAPELIARNLRELSDQIARRDPSGRIRDRRYRMGPDVPPAAFESVCGPCQDTRLGAIRRERVPDVPHDATRRSGCVLQVFRPPLHGMGSAAGRQLDSECALLRVPDVHTPFRRYGDRIPDGYAGLSEQGSRVGGSGGGCPLHQGHREPFHGSPEVVCVGREPEFR